MELLPKGEIYSQELIFWEKHIASHSLPDFSLETQVLYLVFLTCYIAGKWDSKVALLCFKMVILKYFRQTQGGRD